MHPERLLLTIPCVMQKSRELRSAWKRLLPREINNFELFWHTVGESKRIWKSCHAKNLVKGVSDF